MNAMTPDDILDTSLMTRVAFRRAVLSQAVLDARFTYVAAKKVAEAAKTKQEIRSSRRALKAAVEALSAAESAEKREDVGESLAPEVQRAPAVRRDALVWEETGRLLPDGQPEMHQVRRDVVLREPRIEIVSGCRPELQPALERLYRRHAIDTRCYKAGRRYREAWERTGMSFPGGMNTDGGGSSAPQSGNKRIENMVGSSADLSGARWAVGIFGSAMLEHVIIQGLTVGAWAEAKAVSEHVAKGILVSVLVRLAEHWEAKNAEAAKLNASKNTAQPFENKW